MSEERRVLSDRYELGASVGRGGMAEVYRGTDRLLSRTVAVKVLAERFAADDQFVARFRREAQSAAGLNHPNVVSVYDTGSDDSRHYIVMEFVEGKTLADLLAEEGLLPPDRVADIGASIGEALGAAHRHGLVHRDVKPANVMLTEAGQVKVMDFGIARAAADNTLTQTGMVMGTASYLSPEQAQGHPVDARSDVYSLGCVLYEMLTGRPPFTGDSPVSIVYKHVREYPVAPSRVNRDVPLELEGVVMRALAKDPDDRYASGSDVRDALLAAGAGVGAAATEPVTGPERTAVLTGPEETAPAPPEERRPGGARWLWVALAAVAVLGLALWALAALPDDEQAGRQRGQQQQEEEQPPEPAEEAIPSPPEIRETSSVEDGAAQVQDVLNRGMDAGVILPEAGRDIGDRVQEGLDRWGRADLEGALSALDEARGRVDEALRSGQITSEDWADAVRRSIDVLGGAMQANPVTPPPEEEEKEKEKEEEEDEGSGNGGRGGGEGRGQGRGQGRGND